MAFIIVYVTFPGQETVENIGNQLITQKTIACANYLDVKSCYWWQGNIENEQERVALFKSKSSNWEIIQAQIIQLHPYEVPCIMKIEVEANALYEDWVNKNSTQSSL